MFIAGSFVRKSKSQTTKKGKTIPQTLFSASAVDLLIFQALMTYHSVSLTAVFHPPLLSGEIREVRILRIWTAAIKVNTFFCMFPSVGYRFFRSAIHLAISSGSSSTLGLVLKQAVSHFKRKYKNNLSRRLLQRGLPYNHLPVFLYLVQGENLWHRFEITVFTFLVVFHVSLVLKQVGEIFIAVCADVAFGLWLI
jgi:hypothetical protein